MKAKCFNLTGAYIDGQTQPARCLDHKRHAHITILSLSLGHFYTVYFFFSRLTSLFSLSLGDKLTGIFTERDYLNRVFVRDKHSQNTLMREVMSTNVVTVSHHSSLLETLQLMVSRKIRTLPVVPLLGNEINYGEKDVLVGMITAMDVIKFIHRLEEDDEDD